MTANAPQPHASDDVLRRIAEVVGDKGLVSDPAERAPYLVDERRAYHGAAALIVRPESTAEVAEVVRLCAEAEIPIVPQGGNTGLVGGATPFETGNEILLSLTRLNRIRAIDPLNYTVTAEAGVILAEVQRAAAAADRLFPLSLGAEGTARIGGNLSTNAGGTGVLRYGTARDLALGLEVVLPDGRVWNGLTGLRKDNTGYDLKQLFIGAEGTLGIITACVLKLFPRPTDVQTAFAAVTDLQAAIGLLSRARTATDDRVGAFEWISSAALEAVLRHIPDTRRPLAGRHGDYVLIELSSAQSTGALRATLETLLAEALDSGLIEDAVIAESAAQAAAFWKLRETVPEAESLAGPSVKHDISVPVSRVAEFVDAASASVKQAVPGATICAFGHVGDGNVHYNVGVAGDPSAAKSRAAEIGRIVNDTAASMGGSISAEHGIGRLRRDDLGRYEPGVAIALMRSLKAALDPKGIMNPGKML